MERHRKIGSVKKELAIKAREAMLSAVQIYNNPNIQFKSETFIVLSIIAWTYLLHAYYIIKRRALIIAIIRSLLMAEKSMIKQNMELKNIGS